MGDLNILWNMVRGSGRSSSQLDRMNQLYEGQSNDYDQFRERLLHGRQALIDQLDPAPGARIVELGGGTACNVERFGKKTEILENITIVDLCTPLLEVAKHRVQESGWTNVTVIEADATTWRPDTLVDCVFFSYSLTMIPDWHRAIDNAVAMLRPGGTLGIIDYYVSRKHAEGHTRIQHSAIGSGFWRAWFGYGDVFVSPDHIPYLRDRVEELVLTEHCGKIPYVPLLRSPYYIFIGEKRQN